MMSDISTLQSTLNALRAVRPNIDASVSAHQFLLKHEGDTATTGRRRGLYRPSIVGATSTRRERHQRGALGESFRTASSAVGRVGSSSPHHDGASSRWRHRTSIGFGRISPSAIRVGRRRSGVAYQLSPGHQSVLEGLEHIARLRGDDALHRHWLEARMKLTPTIPTAASPRPPPGEHGRSGR